MNLVCWCKAGRNSLCFQRCVDTSQPGSPGFTRLGSPPGVPPWLSCSSLPSTVLRKGRADSSLCGSFGEQPNLRCLQQSSSSAQGSSRAGHVDVEACWLCKTRSAVMKKSVNMASDGLASTKRWVP